MGSRSIDLFIQEFLGRAVDPPEVVAMDKALAVLEELGATDTAGALTALGRHMVGNHT
jgi:ATP-dependent RNA helicase DHX57